MPHDPASRASQPVCRSTGSRSRARGRPRSWSPSTPAPGPSGRTRTGWPTFLEHLVFKGGEKYPTYRDVNEAAERIGAVLNAYTSHDLVAFHITARSNKALEAADLLTDFVGRPRIDGDELNRERGVVVQEIARANDQPAVMAEHLIDEAAFGDHPLGRPVLGPAEHIRDTFTRDGHRRLPPPAMGSRARRRLPRRQPRGAARERRRRGAVHPLPGRSPAPTPTSPRRRRIRGSWSASATPTSRTCGCPTGPRSTIADPRQRAALAIYSTLLGGSMGSRLFDEIREQRGLAYSVHSIAHSYADVPVLQLSAGLESSKCVEAYRRMRDIVSELRDDGPSRGRGGAGPRLRRRRPRDRVREHRRGGPLRGPADDRLRRGRRSGPRRSSCSTR